MNLIETALSWNQIGIATIPIRYRDKKPEIKSWEPYQTQLPTSNELKTWFAGELHNLGIITGWNGLTVIDFDSIDHVYSKWLFWAIRQGGHTEYVAKHTYQVDTSRGRHVYVYLPQAERPRKLKGLDIKSKGGYVLAPPSIHPSGTQYQAVDPAVPILSVDALSEIIPADLLMQDTELPPAVISPIAYIPGDDPWRSAEEVLDPGKDLISQIRFRYRIQDFFIGVERTSNDGRWMMAKCPFHDDQHPSFWIDTVRQICACYGSCTPKPLDVIDLFARLHGLTNRDAILMMMKGSL